MTSKAQDMTTNCTVVVETVRTRTYDFELTQASCWITAGLVIAVLVYKGWKFSALKLRSEKFIAICVLGTYCLFNADRFSGEQLYEHIWHDTTDGGLLLSDTGGHLLCSASLSLCQAYSLKEWAGWSMRTYLYTWLDDPLWLAPFVGLVIDLSGMILKRTNPNIKDDELRLKEMRFEIYRVLECIVNELDICQTADAG